MTSAFIRDCGFDWPPGASRAARTAMCLVSVTVITACSRVDAASAPTRSMRSADLSVAFEAPPGTYDAVMAQRGKVHFIEHCAQCHVKQKRNAPKPSTRYVRLRHLGRDTLFFADGRATSLDEVVAHYDEALRMHLSNSQRKDLVEYLKSH